MLDIWWCLSIECVLLIPAAVCGQESVSCPASQDLDSDVLILGAGISGVAAAKTLFDNGLDNFIILEGTDRIGGRMHNTKFGGIQIELGANWIQGAPLPGGPTPPKSNPIWELAHTSCKLNNTYSNVSSFVVYQGDKVVDHNQIAKEFEVALNSITSFSTERQQEGRSDVSVREAFLLNTTWNPITPVQSVIEYLNVDFCLAEPPEVDSLFQSLPDTTEVDFGPAFYFVTDQRGYSRIPRCLAEDFLAFNSSVLHFNANVTEIHSSNECVCARVIENGQDRTYCSKYGILTFSIGVLQHWVKSESRIQPPLSAEKVQAINSLDFPTYLKIFLNFSQSFWEDLPYILHADTERGYYPVIQPINSHIILVTLTGNEAIRLSLQDKNVTKMEIMAVLRSMYGNDIPEADSILVPTWYKDPFYMGTYTNCPLGVTDDTFAELRKPEGRLYLSGEGTSDYSGYVHGGYLAGIATAEEILRDINSTLTPSSVGKAGSLLGSTAIIVLCSLLSFCCGP